MDKPLTIHYYSDILCIWAWIAERRNQELLSQWENKIKFEHHYLDLFCDTQKRIGEGWHKKGGFEAFAEHVKKSAEPYIDAAIHTDVWTKVRPSTSANAHLAIKAAGIISDHKTAESFALALRQAFYVQALDIGQLEVIYEVAQHNNLDKKEISECIKNGQAIAALFSDNKLALQQRIQGSPSWVMNDGRQLLYGNVGYRVLQANVEELLKKPQQEASWC